MKLKHLGWMLLCSIISINVNAQNTTKHTMETINQVVTQMFVATDQRQWDQVASTFASQVVLDYSSFTQQPAATLTPQQITTAWKGVLPGFESTHHQLGNFLTKVEGNKAHIFCYGTATHYLKDEQGNLWTVVGSYDFDLQQEGSTWKITHMKFNFKYQSGNASLPQKAIARLKK